eukprot:SAG11_NODE_9521_length_903_cov_1.538557_1_plen_40_part_10
MPLGDDVFDFSYPQVQPTKRFRLALTVWLSERPNDTSQLE